MTTTPPPKKPPGKLSPELVAKLRSLTPAQREQAISIAAQLLAKKAHRKR
jgi:hypothetical protein